MAAKDLPDGLDQSSCEPRAPSRVVIFRFLLFLTIIALAFAGVFGGRKASVLHSDTPAARFTVQGHERLRNGNFFEVRFRINARQPIADAVIAVPGAFWHEATINSLVPGPEKEEWKNGEYRIHLGPIDAGDRADFKFDGQLNPPLFGTMTGTYRLLDGTREIARIPTTMKVLP